MPKERCLVCHNDRERLERYDATDELHLTHVTEHKVECTNCHLEVQHVVPQKREPTHPPESTESQEGCGACHDSRHSPQRTLYAGLGGHGVEAQPDVMYRARVRCEGCHMNHGGPTATSGEVACMGCHGPSYGTIFAMWQETLGERTTAIRRHLDATASRLGATPPEPFVHATANLELVERGKGVHNFTFSLALLEASLQQLNAARTTRGLAELTTPWLQAPFDSPCLSCHTGIENRRTTAFGRAFWHAPHVVRQGIECDTCHTTHAARDAGAGVLKITADDCQSCHHGATAAGRCLSCHGAVVRRTFPTEHGNFSHEFHIEEMEFACSDCHGAAPDVKARADRAFCADCH